MSWHEDQKMSMEGFDTPSIANLIQVFLPITFKTNLLNPTDVWKVFVDLTPVQAALLTDEQKSVLVGTHKLTTASRDAFRSAFEPFINSNIGYFPAIVGATSKLLLPNGWIGSVLAKTVQTLVGYLLNVQGTKEKTAFLSANLSVGGNLQEFWHKVTIGPDQIYFYREIQYQVKSGDEFRNFVLLSVRYALKP